MTLDENRADLERHAADFESRKGFAYTVLSPGGDVTGCVYIYPVRTEGVDAQVLSWVRASEAGARCAPVEGCERLGRVGLAFRKGQVRGPVTEQRGPETASRRFCLARRRSTGWSG